MSHGELREIIRVSKTLYFAAFGGSEGAKESPEKRRELKNDDKFLKKRKKREGVSVYLDISLRRFDVVYTAGGSVNSTVRLSVAELEKFASPSGWTDVGKGWQAEV